MNWLWKPKTPTPQKWMISIFLLSLIAALPPMLWRSFVPAAHWQLQSLYGALLLTAAGGLWLRSLYRRKLWRPAGPWTDYGPIKCSLMTVLCACFFVFVLWLDLVAALPMAYTRVMGGEVTFTGIAEKKRGSGRHACRQQLKLPDVHYILFEFCINEDSFDDLPDGPLPARISARQSYFGSSIHTIELAVARSQ